MASQQAQKRIGKLTGSGLDQTSGGVTVSLTFSQSTDQTVLAPGFDYYYDIPEFTTGIGGGGGGSAGGGRTGGSYEDDNNSDNNDSTNDTITRPPTNNLTKTPTNGLVFTPPASLIVNGNYTPSSVITSTITLSQSVTVLDSESTPSNQITRKNPCENVTEEQDKSDSETIEDMNSLINVDPEVLELSKELYAYSDFKDKPVAEIIDKGISRATAFYEEYNLSAQRIFLDQTRETKYVSSKTTEVVLNVKVSEYNGVNLFYLTQGKRFAKVNTEFTTLTCLVIDLDKNTTAKDRSVRITLVNRNNVKLQEFIITQKADRLRNIIEKPNYIPFSPIKSKIIKPNLTAYVFVRSIELNATGDSVKVNFINDNFEDIFKSVLVKGSAQVNKMDMTKLNRYFNYYSGDNVLVIDNYDESGKNGDLKRQTKPKFCWTNINLYNLVYEPVIFRKYNDDDIVQDPGEEIKVPLLSEQMYLRLKHDGKYISSIMIPVNPNRKFNRYYNKIKKNSTDWKFSCKFSLSLRNKNRGFQPLSQIRFVILDKGLLLPASSTLTVQNNKLNFSYINKRVLIETLDTE